MKNAKIIICSGCGAEYDASLPKCPYCDIINYSGAEAEYLNKLDDVRENMEALTEVPQQTIKTELKKQGSLIRKIIISIVLILAVLSVVSYFMYHFNWSRVSEKEQFLWQSENFPKYDALYEAGEYQELADILYEELGGKYNIWSYEHRAFAFVYDNIAEAKRAMAKISSGQDTTEDMYATLLYNQLDLIVQWGREEELSEEERAILEPMMSEVIDDFHTRWQMSAEDYEEFMELAEENYHVLPYSAAEKYAKKWLKKNK